MGVGVAIVAVLSLVTVSAVLTILLVRRFGLVAARPRAGTWATHAIALVVVGAIAAELAQSDGYIGVTVGSLATLVIGVLAGRWQVVALAPCCYAGLALLLVLTDRIPGDSPSGVLVLLVGAPVVIALTVSLLAAAGIISHLVGRRRGDA